MMNKTLSVKKLDIKKDWFIIDATDNFAAGDKISIKDIIESK